MTEVEEPLSVKLERWRLEQKEKMKTLLESLPKLEVELSNYLESIGYNEQKGKLVEFVDEMPLEEKREIVESLDAINFKTRELTDLLTSISMDLVGGMREWHELEKRITAIFIKSHTSFINIFR